MKSLRLLKVRHKTPPLTVWRHFNMGTHSVCIYDLICLVFMKEPNMGGRRGLCWQHGVASVWLQWNTYLYHTKNVFAWQTSIKQMLPNVVNHAWQTSIKQMLPNVVNHFTNSTNYSISTVESQSLYHNIAQTVKHHFRSLYNM